MLADIWPLIAAGVFGGFLAGFLGVGGGIIFIVALSFYFGKLEIEGVELTRFLIANSILATFFAGLSSTIKNIRSGQFHPASILTIGVPGALVTLAISYAISKFDWYTPQKFTILFLAIVIFFASRMFLTSKKKSSTEKPVRIKKGVLAVVGIISGTVSALSGLGGGVIVVPSLSQLLGMEIKKATAISLGVIPIFALAMSIYYLVAHTPSVSLPYSVGYISFPAVLPLAIGVVLFAPFGVSMSRRVSDKMIKVTFGLLLVIVALRMVYATWL